MGKPRIKPNYRRRVLRLPDLDHCKTRHGLSIGDYTHSGSPPRSHALKHRRRQVQHPDSIALIGSHANRNAARLGKRIGNQFKFLAVKANALADSVPEALHAGTNFRN